MRDFAMATCVGAGLATLAYAAMTRPPPDSISRFFVENAYVQGGGTNIVNVILVDFRGFDTLGEITVLAVVALTVYALLRRFRPAPESIPVPEQQRAQNIYDDSHPDREKGDTVKDAMATPALIMALLFPVIGVTAVFLLLRGHDLPGGGFVAGITMAVAFILQYMARGTMWVEARLQVLPVRWMAVGLLLAGGTGVAAWLFARPFLTSHFSYAELPFIGSTPLASALLFDLGVFSLVIGATVLMLIALAHQSIRSHRVPQERQSKTRAVLPWSRWNDGGHPRAGYRSAFGLGRMADIAAPHLSGDHRPVPALLCRQPFHRCDGPAAHGGAASTVGARAW